MNHSPFETECKASAVLHMCSGNTPGHLLSPLRSMTGRSSRFDWLRDFGHHNPALGWWQVSETVLVPVE